MITVSNVVILQEILTIVVNVYRAIFLMMEIKSNVYNVVSNV